MTTFNTASLIIAVIGVVLTLVSLTIAGFTLYFGRKKESSNDGEWRGELKSDIEHIKVGVDELKDDNKDIKESIGKLNDMYHDLDKRVTNVEREASIVERIKEITHAN